MLIDFEQIHFNFGIKTKGVLHVGAHHGQEYHNYKRQGVENIAFFEPVASHFSIMKKNITDENVKMFQVALGSEEKTTDIYISDFLGENAESFKGQSSSLLNPKKHLEQYQDIPFNETEQVKVVTLNSLLGVDIDPEKYDFLNIDVQGYELEVLRGASEILPTINAVYTEINRDELYEGCPMVEELDEYLSTFGFVRKLTDWSGRTWGDALYLRG